MHFIEGRIGQIISRELIAPVVDITITVIGLMLINLNLKELTQSNLEYQDHFIKLHPKANLTTLRYIKHQLSSIKSMRPKIILFKRKR